MKSRCVVRGWVRAVALAGLLVGHTGEGYAASEKWSLSGDYSISQNPSGAWAFGYSSATAQLQPPTTFATFGAQGPYKDSSIVHFWHQTGSTPLVPAVFKNLSQLTSPPIEVGLAPGPSVVFLHPGINNEHAIVRWTAPASGTYDVNAVFSQIDAQAKDVDVHVLVAGVSVHFSVLSGFNMSTFTQTVVLQAGEQLWFSVGRGTTNFLDDSTRLDIAIEARWLELGGATADGFGIAKLVGSGSLAPGSAVDLQLASTCFDAPTLLIVSNASSPIAALGGTIIAYPANLMIPGVTDAFGDFVIAAPWPSAVPSDLCLWFQQLTQDASAASGVRVSNAVLAVTP